ncbi:MAG TPA: 3-dehydroquinate synthase, partial [Clostridiaceae bacterium]|nr:3-dehydroquinate synthase [Clostridiaceae bacterium]
MEEINVHTSKNYKIFFSNVRDKLQNLIDEYGIKDIYLITDKNIYNLYANEFSYFKGIKGLYIINPGEENKNKDTVFDIYNDMLSKDCNRKTSIVSLGGGVVGDIAGFVASTFMRGLKFINIPTTLMAQCDSSVGGKNGFDFNGYKNIIGTFYQPEFVFVDTNFIHTISCQDYKNGLAEIIKYGFIYDDTFFDYIDANKEQIKKRNEDVI